jgi:hypothetical protein
MSIYFNGCSHTFGDELLDPASESWPTLVAKTLNLDFENDAVSGGSNERIVYKCVPNIENYNFFIIAWTDYARFTEYNPVDNFEINFKSTLTLNASLHCSNDLKNNYSKYKDYGKIYYKYWYNEVYAFKQWLQQIILLQNLFENNNKPFIMLNAFKNQLSNWLVDQDKFISANRRFIPFFDYLNNNQLLDIPLEINSLVKQIDTSKFVNWNEFSIAELGKTYPTGPGGHLLVDGHKQVAKIVIEKYNTLYD